MSMNSFHARKPRAHAADSPRRQPLTQRTDPSARARVDTLMVQRGLAVSRAAAQRLIASGCVIADGETVRKAAHGLFAASQIRIKSAN